MSLLAPLYFAGAIAIGLPILFHLIRRQPRGEVRFSSLMFLRPTPPRLTRRSRLDNWPLLLIRALALLLMAAAFTRPFLRSASQSDLDLPTRRFVVAVDTSASMRRADLWEQAKSKVDEMLSELRTGDEIAVVTFDNEPKTLLRFDQTSRLTEVQIQSSIKSLLSEITPSWSATDLGRAIRFAADLAVTFEPETREQLGGSTQDSSTAFLPRSAGPAYLVLVTDMQSGSQIESLQAFAWPDQLSLDIRQVRTDRKTNASAQVLQTRDNATEETDRVRVRVSNSVDADQSSFRVAWADADGKPIEETAMPTQVPPGESRVVRMMAPTPDVTALTLQGDDHEFDNRWHVVSPQPESLTLLHLGTEADEPRDSLLYYLRRVPLNTSRRTVTTETMSPDQLRDIPESKDVPLIVVTQPCSSDTAERLREYITKGGQLLYVLADESTADGAAATLRSLTEAAELTITEASVDDYVMLSRIDFRHPLFATMSDPQFNDFTKIRFWSHRTLSEFPETWNVLARFDDEDPALVEHSIGEGKMWVLAAGWQPEASQLALSTKFIPLIFSMFDPNTGAMVASNQFSVGDTVDLDISPTSEITLPGGEKIEYRRLSDFPAFNSPGIYTITDSESSSTIAVNLDSAESRTETMEADALARFGVRLAATLSSTEELNNQRQLRDRELESRQRLWQWLLVAALGLLGLETFLGGLLSRSRPAEAEATPA